MSSCLCGRNESCYVCIQAMSEYNEHKRNRLAPKHIKNCNCNYIECVGAKLGTKYNPGVNYKVGEFWGVYGSFEKEVPLEIIMIGKYNILTKNSSGELRLFDFYNKHQYAECGTPQLRIKFKEIKR